MTIHQISERYHLPLSLLQEYERWRLDNAKMPGKWVYDQTDIERLSLVLTLYNAGFTGDEACQYMRLWLAGDSSAPERLQLLCNKRNLTLDAIHAQQQQLDRLDYLQYETRCVCDAHTIHQKECPK